MRGWIKLYRSVLDSDVFADPWLWQLFTWCLLKASHKPRMHNGQSIKRGEFITGRQRGSKALGVSKSRFYRGLKALEKRRCIVTKSNNQFTIVSVCNYETYQRRDRARRTTIEQQANSERTTIEQQANTDKNGKKERNKEPPPPTSPRSNDSTEAEWGEVGEILKEAEPDLAHWRTAIDTARSNGSTPAKIVAIIDHYKSSPGKWEAGALFDRIVNDHQHSDAAKGWPPPRARPPSGPKPYTKPEKLAKPPPSPEEIAAAERLDTMTDDACYGLAAAALIPGSPAFKQFQKRGRSAPLVRPALIRALMTEMKAAG